MARCLWSRVVLGMCICDTSTGGGSAAPRVAKPDGVVDGIFP